MTQYELGKWFGILLLGTLWINVILLFMSDVDRVAGKSNKLATLALTLTFIEIIVYWVVCLGVILV